MLQTYKTQIIQYSLSQSVDIMYYTINQNHLIRGKDFGLEQMLIEGLPW